MRRISVRFALALAAVVVAGCTPHYDWREYRPDCARTWCGFVASFPGRVTTATRDVPVAATALPLSLHVVSVDDVTFAVGAFALRSDGDAAAARTVLENKLVDDVGGGSPRRDKVTMRATDRSAVEADTFDLDGPRGGHGVVRAVARFVERRDRLVEVLVVGPADTLSTDRGRQAVETFVTSVRLD